MVEVMELGFWFKAALDPGSEKPYPLTFVGQLVGMGGTLAVDWPDLGLN